MNELKQEHMGEIAIANGKVTSGENAFDTLQENLREIKKEKKNLELELERNKLKINELVSQMEDYMEEKAHHRELAKIEFLEKLSESESVKQKLDIAQKECENLKEELERIKANSEKESMEQGRKIIELEEKLEEEKKINSTSRLEEKKRAKGLLEAVKLFVHMEEEEKECIEQENAANSNK